MKQNRNRILLALLLCLSVLGLAACSSDQAADPAPQEESAAAAEPDESGADQPADKSFAEQFAPVWAQKWAQIEEDGVLSSLDGRAFTADLDHDQRDELIFLYDDDVNYQGVVYRLGDTIEELGEFTISNVGPELSFALYENPQGTVLYHKAERVHAGEESGSETEESFLRLEDGALIQEGLYSTNYGGTATYYDSMAAGANELNQEDYELLRIGMLGSTNPARTISLQPGDSFDCSDPTQAAQAAAELLNQSR
jgi:hypothetical protein